MTVLVAFVVRGLSLGWIIVVVTGVLLACFLGAALLVAVIARQPSVEIGPEGFDFHRVFDRRGRWRRWSDIEGRFVVIKVGFGKGVGYRLTPHFKESAGIKPTTLFAGNDEAISGAFDMPIGELAELLNRYKEDAHGDVRAAR